MKLKAWLQKKKISPANFAARIDASEGAVLKWIAGTRFPRPESLIRVFLATGGKVSANDFVVGKIKIVE
jgi:transcriptional regulator with XRE-family HTH domain|tara:strand:+ start:3636 stop:3842 length:207 start_codon:yes stop_codon:yes gene_type:complete